MTTLPPGVDPGLAHGPTAVIEAEPAAAIAGVVGAEEKPRSLFARGWEVFAQNKLALAGLATAVFMVLFSFVGPLIYRTDQVHTDLINALCPPSGAHLLGCDSVGYDVLGRLMIAGQTSLEVGGAAAVVAVLFGTLYGAISGFIGGPVDAILMRIVDAGL